MTNYFEQCGTIEQLKAEYRKLAFIHHPDKGGDTEEMKRVNNAYDYMFNRLKDKHNATAPEEKQMHETPEQFREALVNILGLVGLEIEICGQWIWVSGDTKTHKETLKESGYKWASKKLQWYYRAEEFNSRHNRKTWSMDKIRSKYGSTKVTGLGEARLQ